ncbi:Cytochrome c551 peroxidase [hydrothermal vent metagenome]|uniref:Cytochrome c551 peroxidase n=1 Tax=hydrothermal vent metagenome TaxID=652676 RepID=A0A1W1BMA2_9ZZZZ
MKRVVLSLIAATSVMFASDLAKEAKNAGLVPIPESKTELMKLIDNPKNPITDAKVKLGKKLYFDPRLSKSGIISCNTCHNVMEGGDDGVSAAIGHKWTKNPHGLNSPTVYNAVFFKKQFWDGRAKDLEEQAQGPIQAAPEMAATPEHVVKTVTSIPQYVKCFKKAYGDNVKITFKLVADTIATFERTLVTPSRYDAFLNGHKNALTKEEKRGLKTFIQVGCASCHNGVALGGGMNAFNIYATYKYNNVGDFKGDKNGMVKVPTLRNITQTAPYFHNGQIWSLKEAVKEMARVQLGKKLSKRETISIVSFLKALDGKKPSIKAPLLPASTNKTPKPQN